MNEMRKLMEAVESLTEGVRVNYDEWKTAIPKNLNPKHLAILQLMSDGKSRERADMIRSATSMDPNPRSSGGFAGWNKLDYDLYKKGLLDVVAIKGGKKIFQINSAGLAALNSINEASQGGNEKAEFALNELRAAMDTWHNAITKFQGTYDPSTVGLEGWIEGDHDVMYDIESELDDPMDEAYQGGKTEHSGAKKGKGAFYGRKKEAKRDSNKNRRKADKAAVSEDDDVRYDPQPGDDEPLEYDDTPGAKKYTRRYGNVTVDFDVEGGEVLITHGHGENIFLTMEEWKEFAGEIQDIFV